MGKHGVGDLTNNGERVINLCEENNLIIDCTLFTHRNIHKLTWTSPDRRTQSQIDHIIINSKWRDFLQDVQAMKNADIGCDHNLLEAKMTLKLRNVKIGKARNQRTDISRMKDTLTEEKFSIMLRNRFSILKDETDLTIDDLNTEMMESAKDNWIHNDPQIRMDLPRYPKNNRREETVEKKALDTKSPSLKERAVREKDKQAKTSARRDKRQYVERLTTEAEEAAERKDMKTVYQVTRKLWRQRTEPRHY